MSDEPMDTEEAAIEAAEAERAARFAKDAQEWRGAAIDEAVAKKQKAEYRAEAQRLERNKVLSRNASVLRAKDNEIERLKHGETPDMVPAPQYRDYDEVLDDLHATTAFLEELNTIVFRDTERY